MIKKILITFAIFTLFISQLESQEIPVLVNTIANAKAMFIIDDSGSMEAVLEHEDFDPEAAAVINSNNKIPSVIFRLESGSGSPSNSNILRPVLVEYNYLFNNVYTSWRGQVTGDLFEATDLNDATSYMDLVKNMGCTTTSSYCYAPGDNNPYGYHNAVWHSNSSVRGSSVFSTSRLVGTDSNGHEYLHMDYYDNRFYALNTNWSGYWPKFDSSGNPLTVLTRTFISRGGTVVFNGKEIFLSAGLYRIEYLRWLFYVASSEQLAELPGATRLDIIQEVMEDLIRNNPEVEFGLASLNGSQVNVGVWNGYLINQFYSGHGNVSQGGKPKIRASIGTSPDDLITELYSIGASGGTPLANTYIEALRYFGGQSDRDPYCNNCTYTSPITSECDSHFVILLTDGIPSSESENKYGSNYISDYDNDSEDGASTNQNCSSNVCANFLDDAAKLAYDTDFNSSLSGVQNVTSYAVGLGLDFDLLDDFAANGGSSSSLRANSAEEISDTLQNIVTMIINTPVAGAGTSLAETFGDGGRVYRPRFRADTWNGNIDVFSFNPVSNALEFQFDIGEILENRNISESPRTIIAGLDSDHDGNTSQTIAFTADNKATLRPYLFKFFDDGDYTSSLLASPISNFASDDSAEILINYIHGTDYDDMRSRDRDNDGNIEKLGDIVYARPIEVGPRNGNYNRLLGYSTYVASKQAEQRILLVGANDGALHAFDSSTGTELWAYIPSSQLPHLELLSRENYNRQYRRSYIDGPITVEDVYVGGAWKTYVMFGLRKGGTQYIVLDITDRDSPSLVFEINLENSIGQSWNKPNVIVYGGPLTGNDPADFTWEMAVPTGEEKSTSGTNITFIPLNGGSTPTARSLSISSSDSAGTRASNMTITQNDRDFNADRIYVGTENGDMFRVHVGADAPNNWTVEKLYNGNSNYPIVAAPSVVLVEDPNNTDNYALGVYFGTGRYDERSDITGVGSTSQRIIGIFDPTSITSDTYGSTLTNITTSNLKNQTPSNFNVRKDDDGIYRIPSGKKGFYINTENSITLTQENFINPVGMIFYEPANVRGALLFASFLPNQEQCGVGGHGFFQAINFRTGGGLVVDYFLDGSQPFFNGGIHDLDGDNDIDEDDLILGVQNGNIQPVVDAYVNSYDADDAITPYEHDGELTIDDIRLDLSTGAIIASVSSLGQQGAPVSPGALLGAQRIVIQSAYPEQPRTGTGGDGDGSGDGDGEDGDSESSEDVPPPDLIPINTYNIPVKMLSFKEVSAE